jgi:hypothetical protein
VIVVIVRLTLAGDSAALVALTAVALREALGVLVTTRAGQISLEIVGADEILDVEERGAFHANVDERGLHSRQDASHTAENDVSDRTSSCGSLDLELGDDPFFDQGDAGFTNVTIYNESISGHGFRVPRRKNPRF